MRTDLRWSDAFIASYLGAFISLPRAVGIFWPRIGLALLLGLVAHLLHRLTKWLTDWSEGVLQRRQARRRAIDEATP